MKEKVEYMNKRGAKGPIFGYEPIGLGNYWPHPDLPNDPIPPIIRHPK